MPLSVGLIAFGRSVVFGVFAEAADFDPVGGAHAVARLNTRIAARGAALRPCAPHLVRTASGSVGTFWAVSDFVDDSVPAAGGFA